MKSFLAKYKILLFFINLMLWASLSSSPVRELMKTPDALDQLFSLLLYLPFAAVILWKLIQDIRNYKKNTLNTVYYIFFAYYAVLTVCRLFGGGEARESLYYTIVLLGSVALYCQIRDGRMAMTASVYRTNLNAVAAFLILYKIFARALSVGTLGLPKIFAYPPVNNLYTASALVMLLPYFVGTFRAGKGKVISLEMILMGLSLILIMTSTSRAVFVLTMLLLSVITVVNLSRKAVLVRILAVIAAAAVIISLLAVLDVGNVRYALSREIGIFQEKNMDPDGSEPGSREDALEQIERSDAMRAELLRLGVVQMKKNFLFGTGDLYYSFDLGYKRMDQTAHNFLVESVVSYGVVGTGLIAAMLLQILQQIGLFNWEERRGWRMRVSCVCILLYYFVFGFVQPSVYNVVLCPLLAWILDNYGLTLSCRKERGK